jgi:hypothetical protein
MMAHNKQEGYVKTFKFPIVPLTIAAAIAGVLMLPSLPGPLQAQFIPAASVTGTWVQIVTLEGQTPFNGVITFSSDGTVTDTTQADVLGPDLASPGHGVWQNVSATKVQFKLIKFLSVAGTGAPDGAQVFDGIITLKDANDYSGTGAVVVVSASGQSGPKVTFTWVGKRMVL